MCANKNINFHSYVIKLHSFDLILTCGLHLLVLLKFNV